MSDSGTLEQARSAFDARSWGAAYALLKQHDAGAVMTAEDLDRLGAAAYLTGRDDEATAAWSRAHHQFLAESLPLRAIRCAFWLGLTLLLKGEVAPAGGWLARAGRLAEQAGECAERGYLMLPAGMQTLFSGDPSGALAIFDDALEIATRFADRDLMTLARHGRGQALLAAGDARAGMADLDEAMVAVTSGDSGPIVTGIVYCAVIESCHEAFDIPRARQWTSALARWCESQPDLVPFRGQCLVHRAQIMQMLGAWGDALEEAERARKRLSEPPAHAAVGEAFYQLGEIHRLRGSIAEAEQAYRSAVEFGRSPQPGLALLRLAEGRGAVALASISQAVEEAAGTPRASRLLPALVEITLAVGNVAEARAAAERLRGIADDSGALLLRAYANQATGAVLLAEGDAKAALAALQQAMAEWLELDAPHEAARTRVLMGRACSMLGDDDTGAMHIETALREFERLGAGPDVARLRPAQQDLPGGLTPREIEILALVASGKTNRAIAGDLVISEKTVARHVSNIFTKIGVSSRSAATAYAYRHGIAGTAP